MNEDQLRRQRTRRGRKRVQVQNQRQRGQQHDVHHNHHGVFDFEQLARVIAHLIVVVRTDAAPNDGQNRKIHRRARQHAQPVQVVRHGVGGNLYRAEGRNHADDDDAPQFKYAVFNAARDADIENLADQRRLEARHLVGAHIQLPLPVEAQREHHRRRHHAGKQRGNRRARDAPLHAEDEDGIADEVHHVHAEGNHRRRSRIVHRAEQRRAGVERREEREAQRRHRQIGQRGVHHVRVDLAEEQREQRLPRRERQHREQQRADRRDHHQLAGRFAGLLPVAVAEVLRRDHRAAGRNRREDRVDEHVNHIHQRHAGNRRLAHGGNHHRISHAHRAHKHLIDDQRNNQPL